MGLIDGLILVPALGSRVDSRVVRWGARGIVDVTRAYVLTERATGYTRP